MKRVLYLQYTNPAGYPPLQHSSRMLADAGWDVLFLGTGAHGARTLEFPSHPRITVRKLSFCPAGWRQKMHYAQFALWALLWSFRWRPKWIYASDALSTPIALALRSILGGRLAYHEHDSPVAQPRSAFAKFIAWSRRRVASRADVCILPNAGRAEHFRHATQTSKPVVAVWNCPAAEDAQRNVAHGAPEELRLYYHGNLSPRLLPMTLIEALAKVPYKVRLTAIGYKTLSNEKYDEVLLERAAALGLKDRVDILPPLSRADLLARAGQSDVGWAVLPADPADINFRYMVGASNKAFDYLACGLALLVAEDSAWTSTFVKAGYARSCRPEDSNSIAEALTWFCQHRQELRKMGEQGRARVLEDWNYGRQFQPVFDRMNTPAGIFAASAP
jgi:glycosyltransferase involved in cell wall biosynthesis